MTAFLSPTPVRKEMPRAFALRHIHLLRALGGLKNSRGEHSLFEAQRKQGWMFYVAPNKKGGRMSAARKPFAILPSDSGIA